MSLSFQNLMKSKLEDYTILIVDDNPTNLAVLSDYLDNYGFTTLVARDGESALKRAKYISPDIILLDVMMPGMDGFETCEHLKKDKETSDIPVIFMTALAEADSKVKGFEVGAVDYVTKPLHEQEVLARVTTHLSIRDLTQNLQQQNEALSKRALQLETSNKVGQQATSILDVNELLNQTVQLIQTKFNYYFVSVWLVTEQQDALVLQAGAGPGGETLLEPDSRILLDTPTNIISWVYHTKKYYSTNNVDNDDKYMAIESLAKTQSELALPLQVGQEMLGILDIQSDKLDAFDSEDETVLQTLANQIAIATRNAKLYAVEKNLRYMEEERAKSLVELNANKDKFFSIIAHDLKGPFQPVLNLSYILSQIAEKAERKKLQDMGEGIYNSAQNVYNLLENLLEWSRLQKGSMGYNPVELSLNEVVDQSINLLAPTAKNKEINLHNAISSPITVKADAYMLDTVIRNLTSNALKFTSSGGQVSISAQTTNTSYAEISITDTGLGISAEDIEKIFKIDVHHTTEGTANEKGTGLGLIICKEMVEHNGGKIWIESEIGQGTTVKFTAPLNNESNLPPDS